MTIKTSTATSGSSLGLFSEKEPNDSNGPNLPPSPPIKSEKKVSRLTFSVDSLLSKVNSAPEIEEKPETVSPVKIVKKQ